MKQDQSNLAKGNITLLSYVAGYATPILGEGEVTGGQRWHRSKERWWFPVDHCTMSIYLAAICHRMSPTLKSTGGGSLWGKLCGGRGWRM